MARASYDDWTFMGEVQSEDRRLRLSKPGRTQQVNSVRNSFIFLCVIVLLTFMGLVCVYSASYEAAVNEGHPHYYFLVRQAVYVGIGIALMIGVNILPEKAVKLIGPIMFFSSVILLLVDVLFKKNLLMTSDTVDFLFLSGIMYMGLFFAGRDNNIDRFSQLIVPVIGCLLVLALLLFKRNISFAIMYLAMSVTMFAAGGVGLFGVVLLLLYVAVPVACLILSKSDRIIAVAKFLLPGIGSNPRSADIMAARSAIASGSWFGKGLGGGAYKSTAISELSGRNILACICEELGFWGIVMIMLFIAFYAFVGYKAAHTIRRRDKFYSNIAIGLTSMVVWQFILNIVWVLGYLPMEGLPLPFFSYGTGIIPILLASGLIYKITRVKVENEDEDRGIESIQDELMFPERYSFENP
ncbi:MAG: FtsW/RodA/SpoVE family cell cycle protein [Spirochaetales bacterium]|nr:FtsW/RodA/SpoVE family cell cycle protein [Spirochaetales bacterium]